MKFSEKSFIARARSILGVVLGLYWIALFVATHVPVPQMSNLPPNSDKGMHFAAYAGLAFLLMMRISASRSLTWKHYAFALVVTSSYGVIDELIQKALVYRSCDLYDMMADWTGSVMGLAAFAITRFLLGWLWTGPEPSSQQ
jgi:VanZ family protein